MAARIYRRTDAGRKAWDTQDRRVSLECRRVLGLIGFDTDPAVLRAKLGGYSEAGLRELLDELEQSGLVKSIETGPDSTDLDFTGKLSAAALQAAQQARQADLDFTGAFNADELKGSGKKG